METEGKGADELVTRLKWPFQCIVVVVVGCVVILLLLFCIDYLRD